MMLLFSLKPSVFSFTTICIMHVIAITKLDLEKKYKYTNGRHGENKNSYAPTDRIQRRSWKHKAKAQNDIIE